MREETINLCNSALSAMNEVENNIFENMRGRYTEVKAKFDEFRTQIENILSVQDYELNDEDFANCHHDLSLIIQAINESSLSSPKMETPEPELTPVDVLPIEEQPDAQSIETESISSITEEPVFDESVFDIETPTIEVNDLGPELTTPENVIENNMGTPEPIVDNSNDFDEAELDALLNTLDSVDLETVYPKEDVISPETISNITENFAEPVETTETQESEEELDAAAIDAFLNSSDTAM